MFFNELLWATMRKAIGKELFNHTRGEVQNLFRKQELEVIQKLKKIKLQEMLKRLKNLG